MWRPGLLTAAAAAALLVAGCDRSDRADARQDAREAALQLDDSWLTTKVEAKFFADPDVKARHIDVDTRNGIVTLSGAVASERVRDRAVSLARETEGVRDVRNELTVQTAEAGASDEATGTSGGAERETTGDGTASGVSDAAFTQNRLVTSRIQARYFGDDVVKGRTIDVTTRDGVVTLSGAVASDAERQRAIDLAKQVEGVTDVRDDLRVDPSAAAGGTAAATTAPPNDTEIATRVQARFYADDDLRTTDIGVASDQGVVTLSGTVASEARKRRAVAVARNIDQVRDVKDELTVDPTVPPLPPPAKTAGVSDDVLVTRIQAQYYQEPSLKRQAVTVEAKDGVVTLSGTIASDDTRQQAIDIAKETPGVSRVEDRLTVAESTGGIR